PFGYISNLNFSPSHSCHSLPRMSPLTSAGEGQGAGQALLVTVAQTPRVGTSRVQNSHSQHHSPAQAGAARLLWEKPSPSCRNLSKACRALTLSPQLEPCTHLGTRLQAQQRGKSPEHSFIYLKGFWSGKE
uniref:Uncharacterized protein n=1 Tax=Cyanoderma ruficeps TaxID=181631 RepID=A0A8C3QTP8_9PASS